MGAYIVDSAAQIKSDIAGKKPGLTFQVIKLGLRDGDGQAPTVAEWFTPESTPLPAQGSTLEGTLELGDYGWTFKKGKSSNGAGGGNRGDLSPEAQARVEAIGRVKGRCHAQHMAILYAQAKAGANDGILSPGFDRDTHLKQLIDWFFNDAQAAKDKAA